MRAFAFHLFARDPDGVSVPLKGHVGAPVSNGGDPEWAYAQAVSWLRFGFEGASFLVCNDEGRLTDIAAPVTDEYDIPCFAPARFRGRVLREGARTDFTAAVQPPERDADGLWHCCVTYSPYGELNPVRSHWPEHAYELAFAFLRRLIDYRGRGNRPP